MTGKSNSTGLKYKTKQRKEEDSGKKRRKHGMPYNRKYTVN